MDPNFIGPQDWSELSLIIRYLSALPFAVIVFAFSLLTAHAIIPSLVGSGHLPVPISRLRPLLYASAAVGAAGAVWAVVNVIAHIDVIESIYEDWWI